ncbi:MAG: hypothetical protein MUF87_19120 [Anaerolineae bacterium]|jgi:hypothetical protein|nr:hypothetical protein [Anaerolineae bacterium]
MNEHYEKWDELAPRGLALIGFGLSLTGEAIAAKSRGKAFWRWFLVGTIGLIIVNSGIAVFGEAIKQRTLYESKLEQLSK